MTSSKVNQTIANLFELGKEIREKEYIAEKDRNFELLSEYAEQQEIISNCIKLLENSAN